MPSQQHWEILQPGGLEDLRPHDSRRISENSVSEKIEQRNLASEIDFKTAVCIMQLHDNSIYLVSGPGGIRHLPACDSSGKFHNDGPLLVPDKAGMKDLMAKRVPLVKELGESKKVFLAPLAY
jgi:hypothetical protein